MNLNSTMATSTEKKGKMVVEALEEPILPNLDDNTLRIRRNLLIVSSLAIFLTLNNLQIRPTVNIQGIGIGNLDTETVLTALFFIILYQIIHFTFNSLDFVGKWRIRATGTKIYYQTAARFSDGDEDSSKDPEQTSLYSWWAQRTTRIKKMEREINELTNYRLKMDSVIEGLHSNNTINISNVITSLNAHKTHLEKLPSNIENVIDVVNSRIIDKSLKTFDDWFWLYQKEQIFRLIIIEWLFPMLIAIWALSLTFPIDLILDVIKL